MTLLDALIFASFATVGVMYWVGKERYASWVGVGAYALQLLLLISLTSALNDGGQVAASLSFTVFGNPVVWQMSGLGWFFALITAGAALFASWYTAGEWGDRQYNMRLHHVALAVNVAAMMVLLSSADFNSLFIGWELVSWATYLIITARGSSAADAAYRYLIYAMSGAMMLLVAMVLVYAQVGSLAFSDFWAAIPNLPTPVLWGLFLLFAAGFLVKLGGMPFHLWQARAYAETSGANAAFLSSISSRMGLFALLLVLLQPIGVARFAEMPIMFTFLDAQSLLAWVAAFTMIIPTFIALRQTNALLLLAWHGIGQGGFMILGAAVGTDASVAGGLLHVFNHATYQAVLFLAVVAVVHRTGTADLDKLGGLIIKMPLTYIALLMGIIGLAGLPPMNGFVSKWIIYKSLLDANMPLLMLAAVISTLGTILSVYKLIHNIFLGQLRKEHFGIKEVPLTMLIPMLSLAVIGFMTGLMPGLSLSLVEHAQAALGYTMIPYHLGGINLPTGGLNMLWVVGMIFYGFAVGGFIFLVLGGKRRITHQWDNYAGGHFLTPDIPYHYSHNFYPGVMRVIGNWYRGWIVDLEQWFTNAAQFLAGIFHNFYRVSYTPIYLLVVTVIALAFVM